MRIFLTTLGSRGDFEPFLALAKAALKAGHEPLLAVTSEFVDEARRAGIETVALSGSFAEIIQQSGVSPIRAFMDFKNRIRPLMVRAFHEVAQAIVDTGPEIVVYHPKVLAAPIAARKVGATSLVVELAPLLTPTGYFAAAGVGGFNLGPFNRLSYRLVAQSGSLFKAELAAMASSLGVAQPSGADYSLCTVSPALLSRPTDWPTTTHLVAPLHHTDSEPVDGEGVLEFISRAPTVYFGFGSMAKGDAIKRTRNAVAAARQLGKQALIVTGWGGLEAVVGESDVLSVKSVDHRLVFPNVDVAVHHGGAGTVHAALRAGVPSVVVPFIADQPWWGALLQSRKLGPAPLKLNRLNPKGLSRAIAAAEQMRPNVQSLAANIKKENGLRETLDLLQTLPKR